MRIIISPAKKMKVDEDSLAYLGLPAFLKKTEKIKEFMQDCPCRKRKNYGYAMIKLRRKILSVFKIWI